MNGMQFEVRHSDNLTVTSNRVTYHDQIDSVPAYGIWVTGLGTMGSKGHELSENIVTGVSTVEGESPLQCAFHVQSLANAVFCSNEIDLSVHGFHFLGPNVVRLKENQFDHHYVGLQLAGSIGNQFGHGNQWGLDPDACGLFANVLAGNPFNSQFIIPEGKTLPWFPPADKINPDPTTLVDWFRHEPDSALLYCDEMRPFVRELEPYDKEVVEGTSDKEGVEPWDAKLAIYAKLLRYPELRPGMAPKLIFSTASTIPSMPISQR